MDFLNIFKHDRDGSRKSIAKNLISVALADGHLDHEEWDFLVMLCRGLGMTENDVLYVRENPDKVTFIPPGKYKDKVQHVQDLVAMMTIDGQINKKELDLCKKISLKLDLLPQLVDDIISQMAPSHRVSGK